MTISFWSTLFYTSFCYEGSAGRSQILCSDRPSAAMAFTKYCYEFSKQGNCETNLWATGGPDLTKRASDSINLKHSTWWTFTSLEQNRETLKCCQTYLNVSGKWPHLLPYFYWPEVSARLSKQLVDMRCWIPLISAILTDCSPGIARGPTRGVPTPTCPSKHSPAT